MKEINLPKRPQVVSKTVGKDANRSYDFETKSLSNTSIKTSSSKFASKEMAKPITVNRFDGKPPTTISQVNRPSPPPSKNGRARKFLKTAVLAVLIIAVALGSFVAIRTYNISGKIFVGDDTSLYQKISSIIQSQIGGTKLIGESEGQINVLLLGIGGAGHEGPYLTDTMILAQLKVKEQKATLTSIPRDYLVNTEEFGQRKINSVFAETFALNKDWNQAGRATREVVENMSGLSIPYFVVVDFAGFEKIIDAIGGIEVQVERTFTDYEYPDDSYGYLPAVTFEEGVEQMNGRRALIFSRSRKAAGPEGSDYARSQRQKKVIQATKAKVVSMNIVQDAGKINELFSIVGDHVHTNLSPGEILHLYGLTKDLGPDQISSLSLDPTTGIVCQKTLETTGAFVITYCDDKGLDDVKKFFQDSFNNGEVQAEQAVVWLADSSLTGKLYKKAESELVDAGLTVYKVIYTGKPLDQNVVHSVNDKTATIDLITSLLDANPVSLPPPGIKINPERVDVIVILGSPGTAR